jgi:multicomponent Na+:H+ antiporter subunit G
MAAIIGATMCLVGALFFLLSAIGLLRMPDAFNRMQAGTKATTLGSILFMLGIGVMQPTYLGRTIIVVIFIVLTNPVSSNALARAAHTWRRKIGAGLEPDALAEDNATGDSSVTGNAANGTAANGTAANGTAANGTAANGTAANGTAANGTAANGTAKNGYSTQQATVAKEAGHGT